MAKRKKKTAKLQSGKPEGQEKNPLSEEKLQLLERDKRRVARAREIRKEWETKFRVEESERYVLGQQHGDETEGQLVLNHFWATLKAELPNLFYTRPKFFVRPKPGRDNPVEESKTRVAESVLEAIGDQDHNLKRSGKFAVMQNFFRIGVLKCVYDPKMVPNPRAGEPMFKTDEAGNPVIVDGEDGQPAQDADGATLAEVQTDPATGEPLVEPKEIVTDEAYRWEWVHGANMLLPDEGPDMSRWSWVGEEIRVHLDEAKDDENLGSKEVRDQFVASETTQGAPKDGVSNPEDEWFRYFQIWDFRKKRVRLHAEGQNFEDFMVDKPLPEGVEDHPYAILQGWTPILAPEPSPWPYPHTNSWLDPQREYNQIRRLQIEGAKRSARKIGYADDTFPDEDEAQKALQSDRDMEAVRLNNVDRPPVPIVFPDVNAGIDRAVPMLQNDYERITGLPGSRRGSPNAETLGQEQLALRESNLRDVDLQDSINDWLTTAGHKMLQLVKATLTIGMWIKLRGFTDKEFGEYATSVLKIPPEAFQVLPALKKAIMERYGKEKWQRVTREELEFQADVGVVPGSARPRTLEAERQDALALMKILGPDILSASPEFLGWILDMFENVPDTVKESLSAGGEKLVQIRANQAGRNQGGEKGQESAVNGNGGMQSALAARLIQGAGGNGAV